MGTWNYKIEDNDSFSDVYNEFFSLYNQGFEPVEIKIALKKELSEIIIHSENNFWFALAKAFWECKQTDTEISTKLTEYIDNGKDLEIAKNLEADIGYLNGRKKELEKFQRKMSKEKVKPKTRKKLKEPLFKKGQFWTFKFNSVFYTFVVLKEIPNEYGENLIAILDYKSANKPNLESLKNAQIIYYEVDAFVKSDEPKFLIFENDDNVFSATILLIDKSAISKTELKTNFELLGSKNIETKLSSKRTYYHHCGENLVSLIQKAFSSKHYDKVIPIEI